MIGTQVGSYRVVEKLAEGGMGAVWIARHEMMQREAVIKVLLPALSANQDMVRRFLNEARAANQIHHPGIVEIFDMGFLPGGEAYIAMERLRGAPLSAWLQRGPLAVPQTIALARQLGSALGAAHEAGIVHRDLKPDNLFLVADPSVRDAITPGGERLKVLDFGIAKLGQGGGTMATVAGSVFGTPPYMSPEQCTSSGDVDRRSDLYAVGCILFEALTGRPPFGHGGIELIAAHIRDVPPPPSTLNRSVPPVLDAVIQRLLAKAPAHRPQSCAEMLALLDGAPSAAAAMARTPHPPAPPSLSTAPHPSTGMSGQVMGGAASSTPPTTSTRRSKAPMIAILAGAAVALGVVGVVVLGGDGGGDGGDGGDEGAQRGKAVAASVPAVISDAAPAPAITADAAAPAPAPAPDAAPPAPDACTEVACIVADDPPPCCDQYMRTSKASADAMLSKAEIAKAVGKVKTSMLKCAGFLPLDELRKHPVVKLTVEVEPNGKVSSVTVAETPHARLGECAASAMNRARFPRKQAGSRFTYPLMIE